MPNQVLSRFLDHADLVALNQLFMEKTGCFAFLRPHPLLICATHGTWQDRFVLLCTALYVVYHDFGCKYLDFFLDDENCPRGTPYPDKHRRHKNAVLKTLRPSMVHGLLGDTAKNSFWTRIANYYIPTLSSKRGWLECVNTVTEGQWESAVARLKDDADSFYDFLAVWADNKNTDQREQFARSDFFRNSIDERVCTVILKELKVFKAIDLKRYLANKTDWQNTLCDEYANGTLQTSDDLYNRLYMLIASDVQKDTPATNTASSQIAKTFGFSVPTKRHS